MSSDQACELAAKLDDFVNVRVSGLMTMAHRGGNPTVARQNFASLRELRDKLSTICPSSTSLAELSMGMSRDLAEAILEGATMIRVGTALFEGVHP